jgi:iron complex outermembrane receptor protein
MTNPATGFISSPVIGQDTNVASPFMEQNHDILETLAGEFDTGPLAHKLVVGAEQDWFITNHDTFTQSFDGLTGGSAYGPINVAGGGPFPTVLTSTAPGQSIFDNPSFRQDRFGWFGQDVVDVTDRLHVLVGARMDYLTQEYARSDTTVIPALGGVVGGTGLVRTTDSFDQFSPRAGITYDLIPNMMSAYAMYSHSFTPSVGVANFSSPVPLVPEVGDIWEGGIKTQLSDNFNLRTSGYWIREHNVNVEQFNPNPAPGEQAYTFSQAGLQRSQGVEANLTGQLTERLSTISNVSYNDSYLYGVAQTANDGPPLAQTRVRGVPHWLGNVWARYNFIQEQQRTLGMALGMRYVGSRVGDYSSPLVLPSYNVWDLGFYYNRGSMSGMLLWDNIFNTNYIASSLSQYQVIPGLPSNVRMQFSYMY